MRHVYRALFVWLFLSSASPALADDPPPQDQPSPTVRGVAFGASEETLNTLLKRQCFWGGGRKDRWCRHPGEIGAVYTDDFYSFDERGLVSVLMFFPTKNYALMREAFVTKLGKPTAELTSTYKNATGASFEFQTESWVGQTMVVLLDEYTRSGQNGLEGRAFFQTRAAYDAITAEADAKRKKAITDF